MPGWNASLRGTIAGLMTLGLRVRGPRPGLSVFAEAALRVLLAISDVEGVESRRRCRWSASSASEAEDSDSELSFSRMLNFLRLRPPLPVGGAAFKNLRPGNGGCLVECGPVFMYSHAYEQCPKRLHSKHFV